MSAGTILHDVAAGAPSALTDPPSDNSKARRLPITCSRCARVWYRLGHEHCHGRTPDGSHCGLNFSSTKAGDRHRTGTPATERCMTVNEMIDARKRDGSQLFRYEVIDDNVVWRIA